MKRKVWMDGEEGGEKEVCRQSEEWARLHQTLRKKKELSHLRPRGRLVLLETQWVGHSVAQILLYEIEFFLTF